MIEVFESAPVVPTDLDIAREQLATWKARALAAEAGCERREHLLTLMSKAAKQEGRTIVAVGVDIGRGTQIEAVYLQSGEADEQETVRRLLDSVGPWVQLLALAVRHADGKDADAAYGRVVKVAGVEG